MWGFATRRRCRRNSVKGVCFSDSFLQDRLLGRFLNVRVFLFGLVPFHTFFCYFMRRLFDRLAGGALLSVSTERRQRATQGGRRKDLLRKVRGPFGAVAPHGGTSSPVGPLHPPGGGNSGIAVTSCLDRIPWILILGFVGAWCPSFLSCQKGSERTLK